MALPLATTGSLKPAFAPARLVGLAVKHPIYHCALRMIADHAEGTFGLLRYVFGGNRPSQTDPLTLSPTRIHGPRLDAHINKTGISLMTPHRLTTMLRGLPAMLHMPRRAPISDYSKGSRGLSVLLRVSGIFTGVTTSPRSSLRQRPDRYTIRAGRNLPDKEFRYLRTVIVTAAVYRGLTSALRPYGLTPPLDLPAPGTCHSLYVVLST